ncbi:MAG: hypothetical protein RR306_01775 [Clostridia bacterium]
MIFVAIFLVVCAAFQWLFSIGLNPLFSEGLFFWCFVLEGVILILALTKATKAKKGIFTTVKNDEGQVVGVNSNLKFKKSFILLFLPIIIYVVMSIISNPIIGFPIFRDQIGQSEVKEFTSDIQPIDINQLPVVDKAMAQKLADKKLGEKPSLGSMVTIGEPVIQKVNDKLLWAVPLEHTGFFKWINNLGGTDGYITVSATDQTDVNFVDTYKIKYQPSAYLNQNLIRKARYSGNLFSGVTDYTFEINEEGRPFWVVTTYKNEFLLSAPEANGVAIIDAESGEYTKYDLNNIPDWVDRVQPEEIILSQINNNGEFVHGIFNFSNKDKFKTSQGGAIVFNNDRCYYYTGLTSVGTDESAIGFMMIDMVTKESILYRMNGSTEYAAQQSAAGKVQHLGYYASFPLIINVNNTPTYFMTLKDKEGLIKQFAFVSISDYNLVGVGETIPNAIKGYEFALGNSGTGSITNSDQKLEIIGKITRIASEMNDGRTTYKIIIDTLPGKILSLGSDLSEELALSAVGDDVKITYVPAEKQIVTSLTFDNTTIK